MDEPIEEGISRRSAIKRIGVVGAVAWSAPVLSSMNSPAFAQRGTPGPDPECAGATCTTFTQCSNTNPDCVCVSVCPSGGLCVPGSTSCASLTPCGDDCSCPDGSLCAVDTCCGIPVCVPVSLECSAGGTGAARASSGAGTLGG
jgi:hypothetical protein